MSGNVLADHEEDVVETANGKRHNLPSQGLDVQTGAGVLVAFCTITPRGGKACDFFIPQVNNGCRFLGQLRCLYGFGSCHLQNTLEPLEPMRSLLETRLPHPIPDHVARTLVCRL